jgi:hypothetical protein
MSNARIFCIGFAVFALLFVLSWDLGLLRDIAAADYWTAKIATSLLGGALTVATFGDRHPLLNPDLGRE